MKTKVLIAFAVVIALGATLYIVRRSRSQSESLPPTSERPPIVAVDEGQSLENLARAAQAKDPRALNQAKDYAESSAPELKMAGLLALLEYPDEQSLEPIKAHFSELSETQRLQFIEKANRSPQAQRKAWLESLKSISSDSQAGIDPVAIMATIGSETNPQKLEQAFKSFDQLELNSKIAGVASVRVINSDSQRIRWLIGLATTKADERIQSTAIHKLAESGAHELAPRIKELVVNQPPQVVVAAIEAIPSVCPEDRWALIDSMMKSEKEPIILRRILDTLSSMPGTPAKKVALELQKRRSSLSKDLQVKLDETIQDLNRSHLKNRCGDH